MHRPECFDIYWLQRLPVMNNPQDHRSRRQTHKQYRNIIPRIIYELGVDYGANIWIKGWGIKAKPFVKRWEAHVTPLLPNSILRVWWGGWGGLGTKRVNRRGTERHWNENKVGEFGCDDILISGYEMKHHGAVTCDDISGLTDGIILWQSYTVALLNLSNKLFGTQHAAPSLPLASSCRSYPSNVSALSEQPVPPALNNFQL